MPIRTNNSIKTSDGSIKIGKLSYLDMFDQRLYIVFILQMFLYQLSVIMIVAMMCTTAKKQCGWIKTQKPKTGHRCITASERYTIIQNVPSHLCTHTCMRRENCNIINYNHEGRYCQMTSEVCLKIVEDPEFTVSDFSCLQWVTFANIVDEMLILCGNDVWSFASKLVLQSNILVGTCYTKAGYTFVWKNGTGWKSWGDHGKALQMLPWCSATWIPYIPGHPIPAGAVIGGYLDDDPSTETYVISGEGSYRPRRCGYYDPGTKLGYIPWMKPDMKPETNVKILVVQEKRDKKDVIQWKCFA